MYVDFVFGEVVDDYELVWMVYCKVLLISGWCLVSVVLWVLGMIFWRLWFFIIVML